MVSTVQRYQVIGVSVDALSQTALIDLIDESVAKGQRKFFANQNLHSIYLCKDDPKLQQYYDFADHILIDGMPIILAAQLLKIPLQVNNRVSFLDWAPRLLKEADRRGWRIFYLGSRQEVLEQGCKLMKERFPGLHVAGTGGYFDVHGLENEEILAKIADFRPHILFVGMGMPREEHWILDNVANIQANAIFVAGGTMDYMAESVPMPPRWLGPLCLEWSFRLMVEPKRLWRRYLIEPWFVLKMFLLTLKSGSKH